MHFTDRKNKDRPKEWLLGHSITLFLVFWKTSILFSMWLCQFIPPTSIWGSFSPQPLQHISERIRDLNTRAKTVPYIEENICTKLVDHGLRKDFMNLTSKAREAKAQINEWNYIKLKSFCIAKTKPNQTKKKPTKWEKIIANNTSNTGLIFKMWKELIQPNNNI